MLFPKEEKMTKLLTFAACVLLLTTIAFADVASGFMVSVFGMLFGIPAVILIVIAVLVCYFQRRKK